MSTKTKHQAFRPVKHIFFNVPFSLKHLYMSDCSWILISFHILLRPLTCEFLEVLPICGSSESTHCFNIIRTYARCQGCAEGILILGEISQQMARASVWRYISIERERGNEEKTVVIHGFITDRFNWF